MKLFVGLGNPGAKYQNNRHNIGFMALDQIASDHGFSPWKKKFQGQVADGRLGREKVTLLKPETFMNLSLDLAPAKIKCKTGGGHAGHNGLRSIHQHITPEYDRVRMGIGHPGHKDKVASYVLNDFAKADQNWLDDVIRGVGDGAVFLAEGDPAKFMNAVAMRTVPQRPKPKQVKKPVEVVKAEPEPDTRSAMQKLMDKFGK